MKRNLLIVALCVISLFSMAQEGILRQGESLTNTFGANIFYMPESKLDRLIDLNTTNEINKKRIIKLEELVVNMRERQSLADSATVLRKLEADFWHDKLLANDALLEAERKTNVQLRADLQRVRQSRVYYFLAGIVATSVTIGVLK